MYSLKRTSALFADGAVYYSEKVATGVLFWHYIIITYHVCKTFKHKKYCLWYNITIIVKIVFNWEWEFIIINYSLEKCILWDIFNFRNK